MRAPGSALLSTSHHQRRTTITTHCNARSDGCDGGADSQAAKGCTKSTSKLQFCFPLRDSAVHSITQPAAYGQSIDSARHTASRRKGGPISEARAVGLRTTPTIGVPPPRVVSMRRPCDDGKGALCCSFRVVREIPQPPTTDSRGATTTY